MPKPDGTRHTLKDLYHENTHFDFLHRKWRWALLSGIVLLAGLIAFAVNGLTLGIDFTGGTAWQVTTQGVKPNTGDLRDLMVKQGVNDAKIVVVGNDGIRVQTKELTRAEQEKITQALADYSKVSVRDVSVSDVGPTWGDQVSQKAIRALIVFFVVIALYLTLRFEFKMAISAIVAVIHDILITVGVYAITGFEVTPATVVAFLTILGFSLYDTVVVFDKIKENTPLLGTAKGETYTDMANRSLNQVLMRSLNTSFVALLPVASLLVVGVGIMGALTLRDFGLALFVGLLTGAYSSIFVATPVLVWWKEREPRYQALAARSAAQTNRSVSRGAVDALPAPVPAGGIAAEDLVDGDEPMGTAPAAGAPTNGAGARPRKPRGRKRR